MKWALNHPILLWDVLEFWASGYAPCRALLIVGQR
ncbi:hypothetical protein LCGC14_2679160, partial [marine sediment metagenome]